MNGSNSKAQSVAVAVAFGVWVLPRYLKDRINQNRWDAKQSRLNGVNHA